VTSWAFSVSFWPFLGISAMKSTGAPILLTTTHDLLLFEPLSTTFVHILRLKALVSTGKLGVNSRHIVLILKTQQIADY